MSMIEEDMARERRERRARERAAERRARVEGARRASPVMTAEEAAAYCGVSYSALSKALAAYGRARDAGAAYRPRRAGLDLMAAEPERIGRRWIFLRADLDRVLGATAKGGAR